MPATRVPVAPHMITWARQRASLAADDLRKAFPKLDEWERGDISPTMLQLQKYASRTRAPLGYFFLSAPPDESLSIPDFRTMADQPVVKPSPDLVDTIHACELRQDWFRQYAAAAGNERISFVGAHSLEDNPAEVAEVLRRSLGFGLDQRDEFTSRKTALDGLRERAEDAGILVMISGIVGANTTRTLDLQEFRGFSLVDPIAPLIFINGSDAKAGQIFSLAHEIAHIALGQSGVSAQNMRDLAGGSDVERWCNQVAAELLVPVASLRSQFDATTELDTLLGQLSRVYKVSELVILRCMLDASLIGQDAFRGAYSRQLEKISPLKTSSGGDFYNTHPIRLSKLFARSVISDTLEGRTLYRDAYRLLSINSTSTFNGLTEKLGVA